MNLSTIMCYPANTYLFQLRNLLGKGIEIRSLVGANILILDKGYFLTSVGGKQVTCLHHRYTTAIRSLVSRGSHLLRVFHEHIDSVYYFFKLISFFFFFFFFFLAALSGLWDLSSPVRIKLMPPAVEVQSLNHWTTREVHLLIIHSFL